MVKTETVLKNGDNMHTMNIHQEILISRGLNGFIR